MATSRPAAPFNDLTWAQASDWLVRFSEEEVDAAAREQFNDWLRRSPENVHAYLQVSAFWQEAGQLGRNGKGSRDLDVLVAHAKTESNVFPLELSSPPGAVRRAGRNSSVGLMKARLPSKMAYCAVAVSMLLAVGAGVAAWYTQYRDVTYSTGIGEQRMITLGDGSMVTLNANSRLEVNFSERERGIELTAGQALFKVEKDAVRPFIVRSGDTRVQAVGTQFDVNKKTAATVVTVVEGRVAVSSLAKGSETDTTSGASSVDGVAPDMLVSAGEQVRVAAANSKVSPAIRVSAATLPVVYPVKVEAATAWTEGLLVFEAAPLDEVVHEFNRQNIKPLVLEGKELETVRITGTFPARGSERLTRFLQERHDVVVNEADDEIRISRR